MKQAGALLLFFCCVAHFSNGQSISRITADSTRIYNLSNTGNELIIENDTRTLTGGFLKNRINGRTEFACVIDTIWVGHDTLFYKQCGATGFKLLSGTYIPGYGLNLSSNVFSVDSFKLSTREWRQKGLDSAMAVAVLKTGSYANPSWITSIDWSKLTSVPTLNTGSGTSDYVTRWTGTNTLGTGVLMDDGTVASIYKNGIGSTVTDALQLYNTTASTSLLQQYSPALHWQGQGWKTNATAGSQSVEFRLYQKPVVSTVAPQSNMVWQYQVNNGGWFDLMTLNSSTGVTITPNGSGLNVTYDAASNAPGIKITQANAGGSTSEGQSMIVVDNRGSHPHLYLHNNTANPVLITRTGQLLLNTITDHGEQFQVNGTSYLNGATTNTGVLSVGSSATSALNIDYSSGQPALIWKVSDEKMRIQRSAGNRMLFKFGTTQETYQYFAQGWAVFSSTDMGAVAGDEAASAVVQVNSTTKGFLPPRMTTTQRDAISSPVEGLIIENNTTNQLNFYDGTRWNTLAKILTGSTTYDFPSAASGSTIYTDVTVTGAAVGDVVTVGNSNPLIGSCQYYAHVVSANTVRIYFENLSTGGAQDPPSATYKVSVQKF